MRILGKKFFTKEKDCSIAAVLSLVIAMGMFLGFGLFHLTKFETTDEHFWKYNRIEKYYNGVKEGLKEGQWKKTRLNDKPGVTVALINGISVPLTGFQPSLHNDIEGEAQHSFSEEGKSKKHKLYDMYHTEKTEGLNLALRLPGLLFNTLIILPLIFWLVWRITKDKFFTALVVLLVGMNPILVGISQIINPDTFLWGFSTVAIFSYIAYLYRQEKKFILIAGIATGLALLSKYTANLLFLFFPVLFVLHAFFSKEQEVEKQDMPAQSSKSFKEYASSFALLTGIALVIFAVLMPAVFQKPSHFLYGTFYSPTLGPIVDIFISIFNVRDAIFLKDNVPFTELEYKTLLMAPFALAVFIFSTIILPFAALWIMQKLQKIVKWALQGLLIVMLLIFLLSFANAWLGAPFFSLDDLKETSRVGGELLFPDFANDPSAIFWTKALAVQSQNLVFSLTSLVALAVLFLWVRTLQGKVTKKEFLPLVYFFSAIAPLVFFVGAFFADVFVNVRYGLILFPLFAFLGALGVHEVLQLLFQKYSIAPQRRRCIKQVAILLVVITQFVALWAIKPHYFNYHSMLLPKKYLVTDSWGYGTYEAAAYLNNLPNAEDLVAWTDHRGFCQFFEGKCIVSNELYLDKTDIDYFVFSRRGMITKSFTPIGSNPQGITPKKYYDQNFIKENTVFELHIGNRPANFVKVVKVKK